MDRQRIDECQTDYFKAISELMQARVDYAQQWQVNRFNSKSDWEATQKTIESTGDGVAMREALVYVARKELELAYAESKESRQ